MITQEQVNFLFEYKDGVLLNKNRTKDSIGRDISKLNGKIAGSLDSSGYLQTKINKKLYLNHRIIFLMFHGYLPELLDHINGDKTDNRIENLRAATTCQNQHNKKARKHTSSGCKNVCWHKASKKWNVYLDVNKERKFLGSYKDLELADLVAQEARSKFHKEYANHGTH